LAVFFSAHKIIWWGIQAVVLGVSFFLVLTLEDYEALAYGYVPAFFMFAPTYYYHVMLIVPFLFFAAKTDYPSRAVGLVIMFATSIVSYQLYGRWDRGWALFFTISCMLLTFVLYLMALSLWSRFSVAAEPAPAPVPEEKAIPEVPEPDEARPHSSRKQRRRKRG
jgi:hypothetical protein